VAARVSSNRRLSAQEMATWRAFLAAHAHAVAALDRALRRSGCGLDLREYDLLVQLAEAGAAGLRLRDLAERLLINRSNVTRRVDDLAARGLVERCGAPDDARGVIARLTPAGRAKLRRAAVVHIPGVKALAFGEPEIDHAALQRFFAGICARAAGNER
jgi:DNA-binding MarR family transcriptional regulator